MATKVSLICKADNSGWTENYVFATVEPSGVSTFIDKVSEARRKIMGTGAFVIGSRYGSTTSKKTTPYSVKEPGIATLLSDAGGNPAVAEQAHVCVLAKVETERGTKRTLTFSCIPDAYLVRASATDEFYLTAQADKKVHTLVKYLCSTAGLQIRERKIADTFATKAITAIGVHASGQYEVSYAGGSALAVGDKVAFTKLKGFNLANLQGTHKVTQVVSPTSFTVNTGPRQDLPTPAHEPGALVAKVGYEYSPAVPSGDTHLVSTRKRGRPFSARRGRRSAKR